MAIAVVGAVVVAAAAPTAAAAVGFGDVAAFADVAVVAVVAVVVVVAVAAAAAAAAAAAVVAIMDVVVAVVVVRVWGGGGRWVGWSCLPGKDLHFCAYSRKNFHARASHRRTNRLMDRRLAASSWTARMVDATGREAGKRFGFLKWLHLSCFARAAAFLLGNLGGGTGGGNTH